MSQRPQSNDWDNELVKPEQVMYIRKDGHGKIQVSVRPELQQEVADDIFLLLQQNPLKAQSEILLLTIREMARLLRENPETGNFLRDDD